MSDTKFELIIQNHTVEQVRERIADFECRYTHHRSKGFVGVWKILLIQQSSDRCVIQLVDKNFEPPRGSFFKKPIKYEDPYIYVNIVQEGDAVRILCKLRWQTWKVLMILAGLLIYAALWLYIFLYEGVTRGMCVCIGILLVILLHWLIRNIRHDRLTMKLWEHILKKNF